ncbi:interferon regulatory factor 7-like [Oncorhynchus tshawytscha]|uniref:IRF tryptophan pentad repeat domain-containing protein n=1 Tax=Oncorhynchus tshawytscha TaxID=74940 RepID=A0A8C8FZT2_ONCTS|nr:interferon regulatory factor 7-like [Oncorhynchus tshawytscha]
MQSCKPQFADWLIEQVRTEQYTGLFFIDNNKFRVPWKHNSRKDCSEDDRKIFRAWAVVSGKINEHPTDKAKWKTNFRSALNSLCRRFKMVEDHSKDSNDPHKVYLVINEYNYENPHIEEITLENYGLDCALIPTENTPPGMEHDILNFSNLTLNPLDLNQHTENSIPVHTHHSVPPVLVQQPYYQVNPDALLNLPAAHSSLWDLEITISYRGSEMRKTQVSGPRVQLHYQCNALEPNTQPLCFPSTDGLPDHKQIEYTNCILGSVQRGLLLEVQNTGIYGYRQDKCHVFSSTSNPREAHPEPRKMPQNEMVQLLSFQQYENDLIAFKENRRGSPDYTIHMCFGEKFPDGKPLEKKLIVVKVVPLVCRYFHEVAQEEGASSLQNDNISLQISHHNSLMELINATWPDGPQHAMGQYF